MIDVGQLVQTFGVVGTLFLAVAMIGVFLARGVFATSKAGADQQIIVSKMALKAQERAIALEDSRYAAIVKQNELLSRVTRLEMQVQEIPSLRADVVGLRETLEQTVVERDEALSALSVEKLRNAELVGRINQLELDIKQLEEKVRELQNYERDKIKLIDGGDTDRLIRHDDIAGAGTGGDGRSDGGDGDGGERD